MLDLNVSPFQAIRKKTGMDQGEFAQWVGRSRSTVLLAEAGLYPENPEYLKEKLLELAGSRDVDVREVVESYHGHDLDEATKWYQEQFRARSVNKVRNAYIATLDRPATDISPFEQFAIIAFGSVDGAAKRLKFPPVVGRQWRLGDVEQIPRVIRHALVDAGLTHGEVSKLEEAQIAWMDEPVGD